MKPQCAILWDLDGVIVDSGDLHHHSFEVVLAEYGLEFPRDTFQKIFGRNNDSVLEAVIGKKPDPEWRDIVNIKKEEWFCRHIHGNLKLLPGVLEWLKWFDNEGIPQAVASSAPMENITLSLDEFQLSNYFQAVISGNRIAGKPDPKVFLRAATALEIPPEKCIVIEDTLHGMQGAFAGGMRCITVATTLPITEFTSATVSLNRLTDISEKQMLDLINN
jgi:HAD superfamily hydrolase (TIGR01509 family)